MKPPLPHPSILYPPHLRTSDVRTRHHLSVTVCYHGAMSTTTELQAHYGQVAQVTTSTVAHAAHVTEAGRLVTPCGANLATRSQVQVTVAPTGIVTCKACARKLGLA
jgi:hypothetical protein